MDWTTGLTQLSDCSDLQGAIALGGDLSPQRVLSAYRCGVFPWPHDSYLLWFSPDPRVVLIPCQAYVGRSLRKVMAKSPYDITADQCFEQVVQSCARCERKDQKSTWINNDMIASMTTLHRMGYAHSIEAHCDGQLVGGLYGLCLGGVFFGESMFYTAPNASKICLAILLAQCIVWGIQLMDCQMHTPHVCRFGTQNWTRCRFESALRQRVDLSTRMGPWDLEVDAVQALRILQKKDSPFSLSQDTR
ncbi:MAG: leucyl/phenylalanyl-tRNA--protein transferase [Myxococcota bacterium]